MTKVFEFVKEYDRHREGVTTVHKQIEYVLADSFHQAVKALEIELIDESHEVLSLHYVCNIAQDLRK